MDLLLVPIIGAIIGLFTNWLAIKMLFLPRKEYRIMGIKIPFTPGVLPKSKSRVAYNLGNTVGDYVLTDETLKIAVLESGLDKEFINLADTIYENAKNNDNTVEYYLKEAMGNDYYLSQKANIKIDTIKLLSVTINNSETKEKLANFLYERLSKFLNDEEFNGYAINIINILNKYINENGESLLENTNLEALGDKLISIVAEKINAEENNLAAIIKPEHMDRLREIINSLVPKAFNYAKDILENNQELDKWLYNITSKVLDDSVGLIIGSFVRKKVHNSIKDNALEFLSDEGNSAYFIEKLNEKINELMEKSPSEILEKLQIKEGLKESSKEKLIEFIKNNYKDAAKALANYLSCKINEQEGINLRHLANKFYPQFDSNMRKLITDQITIIIDNHIHNLSERFYDEAQERLLSIKISDLTKTLGDNGYLRLKEIFAANQNKIIDHLATAFVSKFNIKKTVEDKLNSLDAREMEEIILHVAKKELNYITYMGGLLGFIMGFIPELIKSFGV